MDAFRVLAIGNLQYADSNVIGSIYKSGSSGSSVLWSEILMAISDRRWLPMLPFYTDRRPEIPTIININNINFVSFMYLI